MSDMKKGQYAVVSREEELGTSLVSVDPVAVAIPTAAVPMVELVAPATLMEGYKLETQIGEQVFTVAIPPGGVEKGQTFTVPMPTAKDTLPPSYSASFVTKEPRVIKESSIPVGQWKDNLCDCCSLGLCHATLCLTYCCPLLAIGQVITRMKLNWLGLPTSRTGSQTSAFRTLTYITILYFAIYCIYNVVVNMAGHQSSVNQMNSYSSSNNNGPTSVILLAALVMNLISMAYLFLIFVTVYNVRSHIRSKYSIPETEKCGTGMEDCCCAWFCHCCATAQMLRHTGDYENQRAECCTDTGHFHVV